LECGINLAQKQINKLDILKIAQKEYVVVLVQEETIELYEIIKKNKD